MNLTKLFEALGAIPFKVYPFVIAIFFLVYYKPVIDKYLYKQIEEAPISIEEASTQQLIVDDSLESLRKLTDADRAYILQFHNGTYLFEEGHQLKFSMTYEKHNENISSLHDLYQNLPTSIYSWYFNKVWKDEARFADVSEIDNFTARSGFEKINTKSHVGVPCYRNGKPFAVVCLGWVNRKPNPEKILINFNLKEWDSEILFSTLKKHSQDIADKIPTNP